MVITIVSLTMTFVHDICIFLSLPHVESIIIQYVYLHAWTYGTRSRHKYKRSNIRLCLVTRVEKSEIQWRMTYHLDRNRLALRLRLATYCVASSRLSYPEKKLQSWANMRNVVASYSIGTKVHTWHFEFIEAASLVPALRFVGLLN